MRRRLLTQRERLARAGLGALNSRCLHGLKREPALGVLKEDYDCPMIATDGAMADSDYSLADRWGGRAPHSVTSPPSSRIMTARSVSKSARNPSSPNSGLVLPNMIGYVI
jgi:hypothetical protein